MVAFKNRFIWLFAYKTNSLLKQMCPHRDEKVILRSGSSAGLDKTAPPCHPRFPLFLHKVNCRQCTHMRTQTMCLTHTWWNNDTHYLLGKKMLSDSANSYTVAWSSETHVDTANTKTTSAAICKQIPVTTLQDILNSKKTQYNQSNWYFRLWTVRPPGKAFAVYCQSHVGAW